LRGALATKQSSLPALQLESSRSPSSGALRRHEFPLGARATIVRNWNCAPCSGAVFAVKFQRQDLAREEKMLRGVLLAALIATFAGGAAFAQETCESKAVGKDGKALAGAAKTSFMKKCMAESCTTKAVGSDGKPLSGAAKNSFMKKCETGA
jgi:hypothetical protein